MTAKRAFVSVVRKTITVLMTQIVTPVCIAESMKTGHIKPNALNLKQNLSFVAMTMSARTINTAGIQMRLTNRLDSRHAFLFIANQRELSLDGTLRMKINQL